MEFCERPTGAAVRGSSGSSNSVTRHSRAGGNPAFEVLDSRLRGNDGMEVRMGLTTLTSNPGLDLVPSVATRKNAERFFS
jgi:hypothetical protein